MTRAGAVEIEIFPADARPILLAVHVCPTDAYNGAQHACREEGFCQTGRQHLIQIMSTCQTCINGARAPARESGRSCNSANPVPCPTSKPVTLIWAGPTELCPSHPTSTQSDGESCAGTCTAPSRVARPEQGLPGSLPTYRVRDTAWDKIPRLAEAKNPGPEPPRSYTSTERTDNGIPFDYVLRTEVGSGMCILSPHFEWRKDPPRTKH